MPEERKITEEKARKITEANEKAREKKARGDSELLTYQGMVIDGKAQGAFMTEREGKEYIKARERKPEPH